MKNDQKIKRKWLKRITFGDQHDAFTDLVYFNQSLFVTYRVATNHVSGDGKIHIACLDKEGNRLFTQRLSINGADLRDPKLSVTPNNEMMLLAYARYPDDQNRTMFTQNLTWQSQTGDSWSSPTNLGINRWWLWRTRWLPNTPTPTAIGFAYNRRANQVDLYQGNPNRYMEQITPAALSLQQHGLGYPNESDLVCHCDGRVSAIVRRDADSFTAQLGLSNPPYKKWRWFDLQEYVGGPVMHKLSEDSCLVAGRAWTGSTFVTRLWQLDLNTKALSTLDTLPSAGDNSYPGITVFGRRCWLSYYSSHIDNNAAIYLAEYELAES